MAFEEMELRLIEDSKWFFYERRHLKEFIYVFIAVSKG